jgi:hypothetical protein
MWYFRAHPEKVYKIEWNRNQDKVRSDGELAREDLAETLQLLVVPSGVKTESDAEPSEKEPPMRYQKKIKIRNPCRKIWNSLEIALMRIAEVA